MNQQDQVTWTNWPASKKKDWPRHGTACLLQPEFRRRLPPFVGWAYWRGPLFWSPFSTHKSNPRNSPLISGFRLRTLWSHGPPIAQHKLPQEEAALRKKQSRPHMSGHNDSLWPTKHIHSSMIHVNRTTSWHFKVTPSEKLEKLVRLSVAMTPNSWSAGPERAQTGWTEYRLVEHSTYFLHSCPEVAIHWP